jgi:hypothetical protein
MRVKHLQSGQTLVETVVGIFLMTIGISASVGLASYIFGQSTSAVKQLVATGLAREGIEAVFNMRANNWLRSGLSNACYDYTTGTNVAYCRDQWLEAGGTQSNMTDGKYNLRGNGGGKNYTLDFDTSQADSAEYWQLALANGSTNFQLYTDTSANLTSGKLYSTSSSVGPASGYYRQIRIEEDTTAPYNNNIGPRLKVYSRVWWTDKGCPVSATWPSSGRCRVELISYLTNWRNY